MLTAFLRTIVLYLVLTLVIRLMGKRQLGEMEPAEFVVAMLIADLAAVPMQDGGIPLLSGIIPILTLLGLQLLMAAGSLKWVWFRRLLCGKPVMLISEGKISVDALRRARITLDELSEHLREKDVLEISNVQYAILETNGQISVFPYPKYRPASAMDAGIQAEHQHLPITIITDGKILWDNLPLIQKDRDWLLSTLEHLGYPAKETLLLTVDSRGKVYHLPREGQP